MVGASTEWLWHRGEVTEIGGLLTGVQKGTAIGCIDKMALVKKLSASKYSIEMEWCKAFLLVADAWDITWTDGMEVIDVFVEKMEERLRKLGRRRGVVRINWLVFFFVCL